MHERLGIGEAPDVRQVPTSQVAYLTEERLELARWMDRYAPSLSELYLGAVHLLDGPAIPGRMVLICHAVREIMNRLPERVSGTQSGGTLQYPDKIERIAREWQQAGLGLDIGVPVVTDNQVVSPTTASRIDVPVPPHIFVLITGLIRDHVHVGGKPEQTARSLFEAAVPEAGSPPAPVVTQWLTIRKWFVQRAHDSRRVDAEFDQDELRVQFQLFERSLLAVARGFHTTLDTLDAILDETNR